MKQYNYIFFDFDGTLVNTLRGTKESALYALKKFDIKVEDPESIGKIFCGPPLRESFKKYGLNDIQIGEAINLYREFQSKNTIEFNETYIGIEELLNSLKKSGKKLIIVTLKFEETAVKILKHLNIFQYFDLVCGASKDNSRNSKKEVIKYAINSTYQINLEESIMIGDRISDIEAGIFYNMDTVGVLYGMDNKKALEEAGANFLIEKPCDLLNIIKI